MNSKNQGGVVMRDYAHTDARSVRAGLEGRDDGRVARYERYFQAHLAKRGQLTVNEIYQAGFRAAHEEGVADEPQGDGHHLGRLVPLAGVVLGAALGYLIG